MHCLRTPPASELTDMVLRKVLHFSCSLSMKSLRNSIKLSLPWKCVKLASVCSVLATSVRFLPARSSGYSVSARGRSGIANQSSCYYMSKLSFDKSINGISSTFFLVTGPQEYIHDAIKPQDNYIHYYINYSSSWK